MSRYRFCFASAGCLALLMLSAPAVAYAQPVTGDYFTRTAESELALRRVEQNHLGKAFDNLRSGRPGRLLVAKNELDAILNQWPNHPRVLALQANTLMRLGQADQIGPYFERAYQVTPAAAELHVAHGFVLLRMGKVDEAIARLKRGVELDANSVDGHYNLGLALVLAKRFDEANRHAQLAYALGHPLPGLREQLERARAWRPGPVAGSAAAPAQDKK
jgi:tetratricopeptide (TPR) repeat protein